MVTLRDALAAAVGHHQAGRLAEARPLYLSILRGRPDHPDALHLLGVLESQQGRPRAAVPLLRRAVALLPGDADYTGNLALALRASGDAGGAAAAFARALTLDPALPEAAYNLGNLLLAGGDAAGAAARYRQALAHRADFAPAWNNLGSALLALGRAGEAAAAFAEALALRPEDADARANRANALAALGDAAGAGRLRRQAVALAPAHPDALYNDAIRALDEAGLNQPANRPVPPGRTLDPARVARAVAGLARVLTASPGHGPAGDALIGTALKLVQAGRADGATLDRAARAAPAALRRNPRDSHAAAVAAYRLYRRGRADLASRLMGRFTGRFSPAEVAADFELRTWSMVRAERSFLDGLPSVESLLGDFAPPETVFDPPPGDGPLLAVSCDDGYYRRFVGALLASVAAAGGPPVQVHVINPSPQTEADLTAWRGRLPLGFSRERVDFTGWDDHRRTTYYACVRFLRWHQLLERLDRPLVHVDADCTVADNLGALAAEMAGHDVGLLRDSRGRGPTREITVCFAWFQPTARGRAYLGRTAAYIGHFLRRGRGYWMLDQAAPFCVLDGLARRGEGPEVRWFDFLDFPWIRFIGEK